MSHSVSSVLLLLLPCLCYFHRCHRLSDLVLGNFLLFPRSASSLVSILIHLFPVCLTFYIKIFPIAFYFLALCPTSIFFVNVTLSRDSIRVSASPGTLTELTTLQVSDNPLAFPPAEVIRGGTRAILGFLKSRCPTKETQAGSLPAARGRGGEGSPFAEGATDGGGARSEEPRSGEDEGSGGRPEHLLHEESSGESGSWSDASGQECEEFPSSQQSKMAADACSLPSIPSVAQPPLAEAAGGFRIDIKNSDSLEEQEMQLHLQVPPQDSGRDTLGRPPSPTSACLLTPNNEFPSRPEYDLPLDGQCHPPHLEGECHDHDDEDSLGWRCECFRSISPVARDRMRVVSYSKPKNRLAKNTSSDQEPPAESGGSAEPQEQENIFPTGATIAQRRSLHLRLQGDWQTMVEDDLESLEGDIGEGYRRPLSDSDEDEKDKRKVNASSRVRPSAASLPTLSHTPRFTSFSHAVFPVFVPSQVPSFHYSLFSAFLASVDFIPASHL